MIQDSSATERQPAATAPTGRRRAAAGWALTFALSWASAAQGQLPTPQSADLSLAPLRPGGGPQPKPCPDRASLQPVRRAVLAGDHALALSLLEPAAPCSPAERYLRALLLASSARHQEAVSALDGLELLLPELQSRIVKQRQAVNEAALTAADKLSDVARVLSIASDSLSRGDGNAAKRALDRAAQLKPLGSALGDLHALRSQWAIDNKDRYRAYMDWRWLLLNQPAHPAAPWAEAQLALHYPDHPLTRDERLARLKKFREDGESELLDKEIDALAALKPGLNPAVAARYRGMTAYRARRYEDAAHWLLIAAETRGLHVPEARYYAGRALLRLGRLGEARTQFRWVAQDAPKRSLTGLALFRLAQAHAFAGDWTAAAATYAKQLKQYPGSEVELSARRELAIAQLGAGEVERSASAWLNLRATEARSGEVPLYTLLESLAHDQAGNEEHAARLLELVAASPPLGFAAFRARHRLGLPDPKPEAEAATALHTTPVTLPPLADELEAFGLLDEAQEVAHTLRGTWYRQFLADPGAPPEMQRGPASLAEAECRATAGLTHARRRLLVGLDHARRAGFFQRPDAAPRWLWECVYPTPYANWVAEASAEFDVPQSLIYAIMRQESGFRPGVDSPADAHGLMQIIPPTARFIAQALGVTYRDGMLYDPHINIRFGTYYLAYLLELFGSHPAAAAAGYNAGPEITSVWLKEGWRLPLELFAARIPYTETRNYVQRVLANLMVYETIYPSKRSLAVPTYFPERASVGLGG